MFCTDCVVLNLTANLHKDAAVIQNACCYKINAHLPWYPAYVPALGIEFLAESGTKEYKQKQKHGC